MFRLRIFSADSKLSSATMRFKYGLLFYLSFMKTEILVELLHCKIFESGKKSDIARFVVEQAFQQSVNPTGVSEM